ncbi:hypothetical protein [Arcticibacterium luteifluviistationis]|uniref:DUF4136 domain-containing protein n=1 Tax=Arcticibacterium luteifluviistationis TaxID=1784714 RepID=A0A2Z4GGR5_9BACT|nr:hypothetical protein [Arcticibacterium luteifluviistationis]AWW00215.1 hypothetical protein DJ013_19380 [Arcticibacterium luteifluviistationis]
MFRTLTVLIVISTLIGCGVAKNPPYITEDFEQATAGHKKIAILPYEPYSTWKMREQGELDTWIEQVEISGPYIQRTFFSALGKNVSKGKLELSIQSFLKTNEILNENKITYPTLKTMDKARLGELLDVDAILFCEYFDYSDPTTRRPGATQANDLRTKMLFTSSLFEGKTGKLLWRKNLEMPIQTRTDTRDRLAVKAINSFVKSIPYHLPKAEDGFIEEEMVEFQLP